MRTCEQDFYFFLGEKKSGKATSLQTHWLIWTRVFFQPSPGQEGFLFFVILFFPSFKWLCIINLSLLPTMPHFTLFKNLNCRVILGSGNSVHVQKAMKRLLRNPSQHFMYAGAWLKILSCRPVTRGQCREMFLSLLVCLL